MRGVSVLYLYGHSGDARPTYNYEPRFCMGAGSRRELHLSSRSEAIQVGGIAPVSTSIAPVRQRAEGALALITVETLAWSSLVLLAILTRFWELGAKALHHDESLHAYYSWIWAAGDRPYVHDPLMHGPLLFHLNALVYFLVGASDATSRYAPAAAGVLVVALPYLLRGPKFLGRWGALATSALLLISPTILYQSRYIRHDIYTVALVLLMFITIVRYVEQPERKWLVTFLVATALAFANHEIIFAIVLLFAVFLYGAVMVDRFRHWRGTHRDLVTAVFALHAFTVLAAAGLYLFMPQRYMDRFLAIPWDGGGEDSPRPTRENQLNYYQDLLTNWLIVGLALVGVIFVVGMIYLLRSYRRYAETGEGWLDDATEQSPSAALREILADHRGLLIGGGLFLLCFVGLFTTLFTNWKGVFTSTTATNGTILYWLGQHDVQRGEQPWFYFLLLLPQYEFLPITIGAGLALLTVWRSIRVLVTGEPHGHRFFVRLFLAWWFFGNLAVLSWAGEKMPWLIVHIALPGTLLAGAAVGRLIERAIALANERRISLLDAGVFTGLIGAVFAWFFLAARFTYGTFNGSCPTTDNDNCRRVTDGNLENWWVLAVPPLVWLGLIAIAGIRRGWRQAALVAACAAVVVLALLEVRVGWRLSYDNPDVPTEMMVYTQTSTEVKRAVLEANQLSRELSPNGDGVILWDSGADGLSWPLWWYFRDNPQASSFSGSLSGTEDAAIIFIKTSRGDSPQNRQVLDNYTGVDYAFRWHFPEDMYRDFAIAPEIRVGRSAWQYEEQPHGPIDILESIVESSGAVFDARGQQELFRLVMYRDMNNVLGYYPFQVYVRTDLLPEFNQIRY
jgi:predicted membrane-bound mannosyltransferase